MLRLNIRFHNKGAPTPPQECNESGFCLQETMEQDQLVRAWPSEQQIKPLLLVTSTKRGLARATN